MPQLHPREQQTAIASSALAIAMHRELEKHDLTSVEYLRVVHGAYDSVLGGFIRNCIRAERHGDSDTPGGWAADDEEENSDDD